MARGVFPANSSITSSQTTITNVPFTVSMWVKTSAGSDVVFTLAHPTDFEWFTISLQAALSRILVSVRGGGNAASAIQTGLSVDTWTHIAGVWAASDDRSAFVNGTKGSDATSNAVSVGGSPETNIGSFRSAVSTSAANTEIAEFAMWGAALSDEQIVSMSKGFSAHLVRPQNITYYLPLIRSDSDVITSGSFSEVGSIPVTDHPPIIGAIAA